MDGAPGRRRPGQHSGAHLVQPARLRRTAPSVRGRRPCGRGRPHQSPPAHRPRPKSHGVLRVPAGGLPHPSARHRPSAHRTLAVRRPGRPGRGHRPGRPLVAGHGVLLPMRGRHPRSEDRGHLRTHGRRPPGPGPGGCNGGGHGHGSGRGCAAVLRPPGRRPGPGSPRHPGAAPPATGEDRPANHPPRSAARRPAGRTHRTRQSLPRLPAAQRARPGAPRRPPGTQGPRLHHLGRRHQRGAPAMGGPAGRAGCRDRPSPAPAAHRRHHRRRRAGCGPAAERPGAVGARAPSSRTQPTTPRCPDPTHDCWC
ncbi:hypothetical protein EES37_37910 [Streptomyces sp. ADI91-18]|nr:hypothetical protein EES37_37910 [Streptomyces sp. ADI91-18]